MASESCALEKLCHRHIKSCCNADKRQQGRVVVASLYTSDVATVHFGNEGKPFL